MQTLSEREVSKQLVAWYRNSQKPEWDFDKADAVAILRILKVWVEQEAGLVWEHVLVEVR